MTSTGVSTELIADFEACRFAPGSFDHRTHVEVAWRYLDDRPLFAAVEAVTEGLKRLTRAFGAESKYHETITWAFVLLIHDRRSRLDSDHSWEEFTAANADLFSKDPSPLERYYRPETLSSDLARRVFLMPDR